LTVGIDNDDLAAFGGTNSGTNLEQTQTDEAPSSPSIASSNPQLPAGLRFESRLPRSAAFA